MNRDKHESPTFPHQPHAVFQSGLRTEFTGEMFRKPWKHAVKPAPGRRLVRKSLYLRAASFSSFLLFSAPVIPPFSRIRDAASTWPCSRAMSSAVRPRQSSALIIPQHVPRIRTIPEEPASAASMSGVTAPLRRACCSCSRIRDVKNRSASSSCNLTAKKTACHGETASSKSVRSFSRFCASIFS